MILNNDKALKVAEFLLQIKAVKLQPNNPFVWASGWNSPIYCDNRITLSFPSIRTFIRQAYSEAVLDYFGKPDVIAGVATGGIAQGALVAQELGLPFIYIRSSAKEHGMGNQIEGYYEKGQKVVVIEDQVQLRRNLIHHLQLRKFTGQLEKNHQLTKLVPAVPHPNNETKAQPLTIITANLAEYGNPGEVACQCDGKSNRQYRRGGG